MITPLVAPIETHEALGRELGVELVVQRDDLLPFPLASSKLRALTAELATIPAHASLLVTNGSIDSNHCRTLAFLAARRRVPVHLVLHGNSTSAATARALRMYAKLGASTTVVEPSEIEPTIASIRDHHDRSGQHTQVIPGGCHSPAAAIAYRDAAIPVLTSLRPEIVFVASGTGAIQGGLAAAAQQLGNTSRVVGISIARASERGVPPVHAAATWAGSPNAIIDFDDAHIDGGYGVWSDETSTAVDLGWRYGLPLDRTYTGKAFAGLRSTVRSQGLEGSRVLFWHTGGLWNSLQEEGDRA